MRLGAPVTCRAVCKIGKIRGKPTLELRLRISLKSPVQRIVIDEL